VMLGKKTTSDQGALEQFQTSPIKALNLPQ
jgi:hypothetical protein